MNLIFFRLRRAVLQVSETCFWSNNKLPSSKGIQLEKDSTLEMSIQNVSPRRKVVAKKVVIKEVYPVIC